jgi:hypothetical protein
LFFLPALRVGFAMQLLRFVLDLSLTSTVVAAGGCICRESGQGVSKQFLVFVLDLSLTSTVVAAGGCIRRESGQGVSKQFLVTGLLSCQQQQPISWTSVG